MTLMADSIQSGAAPAHGPNLNKQKRQRLPRFPDYVLCGQLNLHRSAENAAALSKYIAKQWSYLRINRSGIISSHQLEINRNPDAYGGLRNGKPLTVTEWQKIQKEKPSPFLKKNLLMLYKSKKTRRILINLLSIAPPTKISQQIKQ